MSEYSKPDATFSTHDPVVELPITEVGIREEWALLSEHAQPTSYASAIEELEAEMFAQWLVRTQDKPIFPATSEGK